MGNRVLYKFIAALFLSLLQSICYALEVDTHTIELENQLRSNFEQSAQKLFKFPFSVQVHANVETVKADDKLDLIDTGYMKNPRLRPQGPAAPIQSSQSRIAGFDIQLYVNKGLASESEKQILDYANTFFLRYKPKITVKTVSAEVATDDHKSDKEKAEQELRNANDKSRLFNFLIIGVSVLLFGILVLVGLITFSKSFSSGLSHVSGALREMKASASHTVKDAIKIEPEGVDSDKNDNKGSGSKENESNHVTGDTVALNIALAKKFLKTNQYDFVKTLNQISNGKAGLKWMLPHLDDLERAQVRSLIDESFFSNATEISSDFNPWIWLQSFAESLIVSQLTSQKDPLNQFTSAEVREVFQWPKNIVSKIAVEGNDQDVWAFARQVLSPSELQKIISGLTSQGWSSFLKGQAADKESFRRGYEKLKKNLESQAGDAQTMSRMADLKKVIPQLVESVKKLPFGEENTFIDEVSAAEPAVRVLLEESIWTIDKLVLIPERTMKMFLESLDADSACGLLVSLPEQTRTQLMSFLPEGNRKVLISDLITRAARRTDPQEKMKNQQTARALVERLRKSHEKGDFKLGESPTNLKAVA